MGESRPFEVNVPRAVAEQQWQRFRTLFDTTGVGLPEFEESSASSTRLTFPAGADYGSQERIAAEFARFAESDIDPAPGAGMNDAGGRDKYPRKPS